MRKTAVFLCVCWLACVVAGCKRKPVPLPSLPPPAVDESLCKKSPVSIGMGLLQVRDILGEPEGIMQMGSMDIWRYDRGSVEFDDGVVSTHSILSDYEHAKLKAMREQQAVLDQMAADRAPRRKKGKSLFKKMFTKQEATAQVAADDQRVDALTESIVNMLGQGNMAPTNSFLGGMSRKAVAMMVEKELNNMPESEREKLLNQFEYSADAMRSFTNNMMRAFEGMP